MANKLKYAVTICPATVNAMNSIYTIKNDNSEIEHCKKLLYNETTYETYTCKQYKILKNYFLNKINKKFNLKQIFKEQEDFELFNKTVDAYLDYLETSENITQQEIKFRDIFIKIKNKINTVEYLDNNEILTTLSFYSTMKPKYINLNEGIRKMFISQKDDKNSNFNSFKFSEEMFLNTKKNFDKLFKYLNIKKNTNIYNLDNNFFVEYADDIIHIGFYDNINNKLEKNNRLSIYKPKTTNEEGKIVLIGNNGNNIEIKKNSFHEIKNKLNNMLCNGYKIQKYENYMQCFIIGNMYFFFDIKEKKEGTEQYLVIKDLSKNENIDFRYSNLTDQITHLTNGIYAIKNDYSNYIFEYNNILNKNENSKRLFLSSNGEEIRISLFNKNSALVIPIFFNTDYIENKYQLSYFKDNILPYIFKDNKLDLNIFENGEVYHLFKDKIFSFNINEHYVSSKFYSENLLIDCILRGCNLYIDLFKYYLDESISFNNINRKKNFKIIYDNNYIFDINNTSDNDYILFKYDNNNNKINIMNKDGEIFIEYSKLNIIVKFDQYHKITFYKGDKNIEDKNIKVENLGFNFRYEMSEFIKNISKSYYNTYKYLEMYQNLYDVNTKNNLYDVNTKNNNLYKYNIDDIYRYFYKLPDEYSESNSTLELNNIIDKKNIINYIHYKKNKEKIEESIKLNEVYTPDYILDRLDECDLNKERIKKSIDKSKNSNNYNIIFVDDIIVNGESLKKNLINENDKINKNILNILNNSEEKATLIEYLYKISNKSMTFRIHDYLTGNLESIIHIDYDNKLRLFFKYDHEKNIVEVYKYLTHTIKGIY